MANGDTKTEQMLDVLANGGSTAAFRGCCNTKTQNYILDAADRIQAVEDEVERLENNPDVADIVATYADLQAYPTSQLTDKDVIRVLQDETHDGDSTYYRWSTSTNTWTYIGESKQYVNFVGTDGTAAGEAGLVPAPATTDAGKFLKADGTWADAGGGGGATLLTSADYDYPDANPNGVALWRLPSGMYYTKQGTKVFYSTASGNYSSSESTYIISNQEDYNYYTDIIRIYSAGGQSTYKVYKTETATGQKSNQYNDISPLFTDRIVQTIGTSQTDVMSQDAVTSTIFGNSTGTNVLIGKGATTTSYQSGVGIGLNAKSTGSNSVAIGTSAEAAKTDTIAIGNSSKATQTYAVSIGGANVAASGGIGIKGAMYGNFTNGIAIGTGSQCNNSYSIALGSNAATSRTGEVNVGAGATTNGYNSTAYRVIGGVYDGQNAHDAATYGQLDTRLDGLTLLKITQTAYDALATKDPNTLYVITGA